MRKQLINSSMKLTAAQYDVEPRLTRFVEFGFMNVRAERQQRRFRGAKRSQSLQVTLKGAQVDSNEIKSFLRNPLDRIGVRGNVKLRRLPLRGALDVRRDHQVGRDQQSAHGDHALAAGRLKPREVRRSAARYLLRMSR